MKSTRAGILATMLICLTGCTTVVKTVMFHHPKAKSRLVPPEPDRTVTGEGWLASAGEGTNEITVLHVRAENHYSLGYHHGKLLGTNVYAAVEDVLLGAENLIPKQAKRFLTKGGRRSVVNSFLDKAWAEMKECAPNEDLDEMRGLAEGLKAAGVKGVDLDTIHRVHALPDVGETSCSALVACGSATRDGHVYQMRILDYGTELNLHKRPLITVYYPTRKGENTFINVGWIGFVGLVSGMNEKGVAISEMGYGNPPGETLEGIPMPFLLKQVLRYANTSEEAAAIIQSARRNNSYAYWLGDPSGHAIGMLTSAADCAVFRMNEHTIVEHGKYKIPQYKDVIYAGHYNEKQGQVVERMQGTLDVASIQQMAREIAMKSNLHTVICDLTTRDMYVANRHGTNRAADCVYVPFPHTAWKQSNTAIERAASGR